MRRTRLTSLACLATVAMLASGCGANSSSSSSASSEAKPTFPAGSAMAKIQQRGKLVVGTAFDIPLFGVKNPTNGKVEGFDADIARLIAKKITGSDQNIEFVQTSSENREPFASTGKVDIVAETYSITPARQKVINFAGPYYIAGQDMLVQKDNTTIKSVGDLNGKTVCAVSGTVTKDNVLRNAPQAQVTEFQDGKQCVEAIKDGRFDTYVDDDVTNIGEVLLAPDKLRLVGAPFTKEPYGIGIAKTSTDLLDFVNTVLKTAISDGTWQQIFDANIGKVSGTKPQTPTVGVVPAGQ